MRRSQDHQRAGEWPERWAVPVKPWIAKVGQQTVKRGVLVYGADAFSIEIGISRGSVGGVPFRACTLTIARELADDPYAIEYACEELHEQFLGTPPGRPSLP